MSTSNLLRLLPELGILVTVIETGSFSAAARRLQLPPSSISRSISRLEEQLAAKLLERTTRSLALTSIGKEVYEQAGAMMEAAKAAIQSTQSAQTELSGLLRIAAPKAFCKHIMAPLVFRFMAQHPKLKVQLTASDHPIDPVGGEVDILIQITQTPLEHLVAKSLGRIKQVVCATPVYIQQHSQPIRPQDLLDHVCIALGESSDDHCWYFAKGDQIEQVQTQGNFASNHSEIRLAAIEAGMGLSIFPEFVVADAIKQGRLMALLEDWAFQGNYQGQIYAQYGQSRFVPATIKAFIAFAQQDLTRRTASSQPE